MRSVLVIDDDPDIGEFVCESASFIGCHCVVTTNAEQFLQAITPEISLIFLDLLIPEIDGIQLLRLLSHLEYVPPIVFMSGVEKRVVETAQTLAESLGLTVAGHLLKPFRLKELEKLLLQLPNPILPPAAADPEATPILLAELLQACERGELLSYYQPQVSITTGEITGVESLARWQHPTRGLVQPRSFIALAEESGFIDELSWILLARNLAEFNSFQATQDHDITLSVNITVQSLRNLNFPDRLLAMARSEGVEPDRLNVEITETGLVNELQNSLDVLTRLRMKNVQLSIDDFGTGYSMLKQLQMIPSTQIKIDQAFVQNIGVRSSDRVMVQKTIEIGHELGMKVVAEGVETAEQLAFLRDSGCDTAQGYYIGRPMAAPDLIHWMKSYTPASAATNFASPGQA